MVSSLVLAAIVFASAVVLLLGQSRDWIRIALVVAAGIALLLASGILHLELRGVPLREVLAITLTVLGAIVYFRSSGKTGVTAATCLTLLSGLELLSLLHVLR